MSHRIFTFLGASDAALSMFIEILRDLHGIGFSVEIVKNTENKSAHPFEVAGVRHRTVFHKDWFKPDNYHFIIGVNKAENKKLVYSFFKNQYEVILENYDSLIHPSAVIASTAKIQHGVVANPGVVVAPYARLGDLVTLNRNVTIGHHSNVSDFCTLHPGVNIAGHCKIAPGVTIGMGTNIIEGIEIGTNSVVGAGSLVTKNIPPDVIAYGSPVREIRKLSKTEPN